MSRITRITALVLLSVLCLSACSGIRERAEEKRVESGPTEVSSEVLVSVEEPSELVDDLSHTEQDEDALLTNAALELLELDGEVIDIFANLSLAPMAEGLEETDYGYEISDKYYSLREDCPYSDFDRITELLNSAYSRDSGVADEYLSAWPRLGNPVFRQDYRGGTELCYTYYAGFDTDFSSADVAYLGENDGAFRFQYAKGGSIYVFEMTEEDGNYRLTDSLLFIDEDIRRATQVRDLNVEDFGSAVSLRGDCLWINVFVSDGSSSWTEEDRVSVTEMVEEGRDYILYQAQNHGVSDLNIELLYVGLETEYVFSVDSGGGNWATDGFKQLSWGNVGAFAEELTAGIECDNYCLMFHFNKYGRSFSVPCSTSDGEDSDYFYETAAVFNGDPSEGRFFACSAVYAHEFLHAFGAADLYAETLTEKGDALAGLYFSYDIMRTETVDIYDSRIDCLTAKLIGWADELPVQLKDFLKELK